MRKSCLRRLAPSSLAAALLLGACTVRESPERARAVFYASGADLQSINPLVTVHPLAKEVQKRVLFLPLAEYDSTFAPVPRLAAWRWDETRTTLEFALRRDVRWHDGVPTTAGDVVWTLTMARHPAVAYPRASDLDAITAVTALDSFTVRIVFARPQPSLPDVLTDLAILPAHRFDGVSPGSIRRAPFNAAPVGNGPFAFVAYEPNRRWVFERFQAFPLPGPPFDRFVIAVVDEPTTKLAALTSGELDVAGIAPAHAGFVRDDPELRVVTYPVLFTYAVVWNVRRSPFDDGRVRRALTLAMDRRTIVEAHVRGFGTVAHGPVPPEHPWFEPVPALPYDPRQARQLLEEAGWRMGGDGIRERAGRRLAFALTTVGSGDNVLEQLLQAQLRAVGADVTIRQLELATFLATAQDPERDFDALVTGIPGDLSLGHVTAMFSGEQPGPLAYPGHRDRRLDRALQAASRATSEESRARAWREVQQRLAEGLPTTWLYHARGLQGVRNRIRSEPPDLRGELVRMNGWIVRPRGGTP
jgi:peptide/nickel transport system substrate-binding protein